jgi:hypothetical protein
MSRTIAPLGAALLAVAFAAPATSSTAFAQAGSTGGTIGNTDKSVSGDLKPAEPLRRTVNQRPRQSVSEKASARREDSPGVGAASRASSSIVGRWRWDIKCPSAAFTGFLEVAQNGGVYTGEFGHTNLFDNGTISNVQFDGKTVDFDRNYIGTEHLRLNYSRSGQGEIMQGPYNNPVWGQCSVYARKNG